MKNQNKSWTVWIPGNAVIRHKGATNGGEDQTIEISAQMDMGRVFVPRGSFGAPSREEAETIALKKYGPHARVTKYKKKTLPHMWEGDFQHQPINQQIKDARKSAGHLSQEELAQRLGKSKAIIGRLEAGQANPTVSTLQEIADATGYTFQVSPQKK